LSLAAVMEIVTSITARHLIGDKFMPAAVQLNCEADCGHTIIVLK